MSTDLAEETFDSFSVRAWIEDELGSYVEGEEMELRAARRRYDAIAVTVIETGLVDEFEVSDVYELPSHEICIEFSANVETHLEEDFVDEEDDHDSFWERDLDGAPMWHVRLSSERPTRSERFHKRVRYRARLTVDPNNWVVTAADVQIDRRRTW